MNAPPLIVHHAAGRYPVYVEVGVLHSLPELLARHLAGRRPAVISDDTVLEHLARWEHDADHPWRHRSDDPVDLPTLRLRFPAGERSKTRETWGRLSDALLEADVGRDAAIVALGGGVVGDLAGFVAATFMRGIPILHAPTTLLAMVDASVGGKTGVDTEHGKNLVGAFHQPVAVVADPRTLLTLDDATFRAGLAEAVKHALIADPDYFDWLERQAPRLDSRDLDSLAELVRWSVRLKAEIVEDDERDAGRRAVLNLGHTIAHGLEVSSGYRLAHGEAVAIGLVAECRLAHRLGLAHEALADRVEDLLGQLGLPAVPPPGLDLEDTIQALRSDKKRRASTLRFALPQRVGAMAQDNGHWTVALPDETILRTTLAHLGFR